MKRTFILLTALFITASMLYADAPFQGGLKTKPMTAEKVFGTDDDYTLFNRCLSFYSPLNTDDPVGEVIVAGYTWSDVQHNASCGRQIQADSDKYVHIVWTKGMESMSIFRYVYYQVVDSLGNLMFTTPDTGFPIDGFRSGYSTLALHSLNRAVPSYHRGQGGPSNSHSAVSIDIYPLGALFITSELPWVYDQFGNDMEVIWPHIAADRHDRFHICSTCNPPSAGEVYGHYYSRATYNMATYSWEFHGDQELVSMTNIISIEPACSPVSDRCAIAWLEPFATTPDTSQYDNNVVFTVSQDGLNWDWSDTVNITDWIPPDLSILPGAYATHVDTLLADRDTLTSYCDVCPYFDNNDVLHLAFSTRGKYELEGTLSWGDGLILHWDELNQELTVLANGWYANDYYDFGAWNIGTQRPCLAEDPATGYLYCVYQRYFTPVDTTLPFHPDFYLWGDTTDFSQSGYANAEIWMTVSTDGGLTWAEGTNITNTHTPNAPAGSCESEICPSMALKINDGYAHVFYVKDREPGWGVSTYNEVIYHKVPLDSIAAEPLIPDIPIHVDPTMYAPTVLAYSPTTATIPVNPGQIYDFSITAEDPQGIAYYEWILETNDSTSFANVLSRVVISNDSAITVTASAVPLPGYQTLKGRAYGFSYFNEKVWYIQNYEIIVPTPEFTISVTPYNPPVIIPAAGGTFDFNIAVQNQTASAVTTDIWTIIELPGVGAVGPLMLIEEYTFPAFCNIDRDRDQSVPAIAPAGLYIYYAYAGQYPWAIDYYDYFTFTKEGASDGVLGAVEDWICSGEPFGGETISDIIPQKNALHPAYPNPFNAKTVISFELRDASEVSLVIYDVQGREVRSLVTGHLSLGEHEVVWDAEGMSSGIYFARLQAGDFTQTQKLLLIK
ncbi:T9SS type A sorting domain-containing protein [bacterium]|nr:T9SS type A sorting domain-containing protein [bacterium]